MSSCITQKRCNERFPAIVTEKTTIRDTTIGIPGKTTSTTILLPTLIRDTVTIHDTITKIKTRLVKLPGDTIWLETECPPDSVTIKGAIRETEKTITPPPSAPEKPFPWWWKVLAVSALLFSGGYMARSIAKFKD